MQGVHILSDYTINSFISFKLKYIVQIFYSSIFLLITS